MKTEIKHVHETALADTPERGKVKFVVYGEEMIEREVKRSGNSGRIYLPPYWIDRRVKIIKID